MVSSNFSPHLKNDLIFDKVRCLSKTWHSSKRIQIHSKVDLNLKAISLHMSAEIQPDLHLNVNLKKNKKSQ